MSTRKDMKGRNLNSGEDQMKDGRYRFRYADKYGERKVAYAWRLVPTDKTPKGKRDDLSLREKEHQIMKDLENGIRPHEGNITVSELITKYLESKSKLATTTCNNYYHIKCKNIDPHPFSRLLIKNVKKSDVKNFYSYLYKNKNFSDGTIQLYQNLIYPAFQMAVDDEILKLNPCKGCMKEYDTNSLVSKQTPLTAEEQNFLLNFVKRNSFYCDSYYLIALILSTGCRIGEALGLTWNDINFDDKYLDINHQLIYKEKVRGEGMRYFICPPKNRKCRQIPLQENTVTLLKQLKSERYFVSKTSSFSVDGYSEFVFLNKNDKVTTPGCFNRTLSGIKKAIDKENYERAIEEKVAPVAFPKMSAHTLRHTFCTRMAENGCDVKVLQEIMGHKNISITMQVYNHASFERNKKMVESLNQVLENIV